MNHKAAEQKVEDAIKDTNKRIEAGKDLIFQFRKQLFMLKKKNKALTRLLDEIHRDENKRNTISAANGDL